MTQLKRIILSFIILIISPFAESFAQVSEAIQENIIMSAVSKFDNGDFDGAIRMLKSVVDHNSESDAAYYYLALSYFAKDNLELAETYLRRANELDNKNFWYRHRLALLYTATKRPELAVDIYEGLLTDFPKKSDLYFELIELYSAREEFEKALDILDEIETVFGKTESTVVYRFNLLRKINRQDEAFKSLEDYNKEYSSPYVLTALADWQISMYNDSTALRYYDEALDIAPDYAPALLGKAETLRMTRKYGEYFSVLDKFVSDPHTPVDGKSDYLSAIIQRTDPKFMRSFMPQMDVVIEKTLQVHPTDSTMMGLAAIWYYSTDRKETAGKWFSRNAIMYPESVSARASLVEYLMYVQEWEQLSKEGRQAFEAFPQEPAFLEMASVGDFNLGRYEEVMEICDKVLQVAPADSSKTLRAWSTKGDIYHRMGDSKKAYKAYDKALKINPDYVYVLNNYAYYLSVEKKNLDKAEEMRYRTVKAEPANATYLDTYAWILFEKGKYVEARIYIDQAMQHGGGESSVVVEHCGDIYYLNEEKEKALEYWKKALELANEPVQEDSEPRSDKELKLLN